MMRPQFYRAVSVGLLFTGILMISSCVQDRSRDPELAPLVGQTAQLTTAYKLCTPLKPASETSWWENTSFLFSTTSYYLDDASIETACRQDYYRLIATLPAGSEIKILSFQTMQGILSVEGNLQAIVEVESPEEAETVRAEIHISPEGDTYEFPWQIVE